MPIPLLIALLIAFGLDLPVPEQPGASLLGPLLGTAGGLLVVASAALGLGVWVARRVSRLGYASGRLIRRYSRISRLLTVAGLGIYAWILYRAGWYGLVLHELGLREVPLIDDLLVFLPFVLIQLLAWSGQYVAERALHGSPRFPGMPAYLLLKSRQAAGLLLPVVLIFVFRQDVFARLWPRWHQSALAEPLELSLLAAVVLMASPLFIRLAWPTRSLPEGPLRRRLEGVARRVGFRFNDLLVWDTGHLMVNACVTGVLPRFRYVLLTDALIDSLSPAEVAAVFGHEVGHVAHRHLPFFGFFFLGTLGLLALGGEVLSVPADWFEALALPGIAPAQAPQLGDLIGSALIVALLGVLFWFLFGVLSRRFERQADVFGCRVVSCGVAGCPPHLDLEEPDGAEARRGAAVPALCPVGIQIFSGALASVAQQNGIDPTARSWRHGSIGSRLAFLRDLQLDPAAESGFQRRVNGLRLLLTALLSLGLVLAAGRHLWS